MKKIICLITTLCLVLGSFSFCFAATTQSALLTFGTGTGSLSAKTVMQTIINYLAQSYQSWDSWISLDANGNQPASIPTFIDLYNQLKTISTFLTVTIENPLVFTIGDYIAGSFNYLASIDSTNQGINSTTMEFYSDFLTNSTNNHNDIARGLYNTPWWFDTSLAVGRYSVPALDWQEGFGDERDVIYYYQPTSSKLDYVAWLLQKVNMNQVDISHTLVTDVDSTLSVWDSQQDTLTQEEWVPTSLGNGLYKYLAYLQRDVARLTYVLASQEEIDAREASLEQQQAVVDNFYGDSGAAVSTGDVGEMSGASTELQDSMATGYSSDNIWTIFSSDNYTWFSQETANNLDATNANNRSTLRASAPGSDTPLLDQQINEILSMGGMSDAN